MIYRAIALRHSGCSRRCIGSIGGPDEDVAQIPLYGRRLYGLPKGLSTRELMVECADRASAELVVEVSTSAGLASRSAGITAPPLHDVPALSGICTRSLSDNLSNRVLYRVCHRPIELSRQKIERDRPDR